MRGAVNRLGRSWCVGQGFFGSAPQTAVREREREMILFKKKHFCLSKEINLFKLDMHTPQNNWKNWKGLTKLLVRWTWEGRGSGLSCHGRDSVAGFCTHGQYNNNQNDHYSLHYYVCGKLLQYWNVRIPTNVINPCKPNSADICGKLCVISAVGSSYTVLSLENVLHLWPLITLAGAVACTVHHPVRSQLNYCIIHMSLKVLRLPN